MISNPARLYLQEILEDTFPERTVYYRPPGDAILPRPCIVYTALQFEPTYANNVPYSLGIRFQVTFLSDRVGPDGLGAMYSLKNVIVTNHQSYFTEDVAHDVFTVTINSI